MKSAIEQALNKVKDISITEIQPPKKDHEADNPITVETEFYKPTLYLDDSEFPNAKDYRAGDKVILIVEATVRRVSAYDQLEGKTVTKSLNIDLCIDAIADITKG